MEADLQRCLATRGTAYRDLNGGLLAQLAGVAEQHGLAAKQAAVAFDKFIIMHRPTSTSVTEDDVAAWGLEVGRSKPQTLGAARASNLFNRVSLEDMVLASDAREGSGDADGAHHTAPSQRITPYMNRVAHRPTSAAKVHTPLTEGKFAERQGAGSVMASLNAHLVVAEGSEGQHVQAEGMEVDGEQGAEASASPRCEVAVLGPSPAPGAKYMLDRLEDKVAYLEGRIVAAEEAAEAALDCHVHPTSTAAQRTALFVGRICCDSERGRLNAQSLLLEGSQRTSLGSRVRLDLSRCPNYRLFPGQVVALLGSNPSGHCVVATHILQGLGAAQLPRTPLQDMAAMAAAAGPRGTSMVVAAGPFTCNDNLEYAPLGALLDYCAAPGEGQPPPDVVLLVGPFVDEEHPLIRSGGIDECFEDIYASRVLGQVRRFTARHNNRTQVLLVPSTRDVHQHPVLPQPAPAQEEAQAAGAQVLTNPATLRCNEVVLGVGSADWLMACSREEVARTAAPEDRLPALAAQLPAQRSYFPMFPAPGGTPLDCSRAASGLHMPCAPDVLVLASDLAPFAKLCTLHQLDDAAVAQAKALLAADSEAAAANAEVPPPATLASGICINPGRLAKGASGGTFAHVHILPLPEALAAANGSSANDDAPVPHQVDKRCRVDIRRI